MTNTAITNTKNLPTFDAVKAGYLGLQTDKSTFKRLPSFLEKCISDGVVTLYAYNVSSGNWTTRALDCNLRNVKNAGAFARIIARAWYQHHKDVTDESAAEVAKALDAAYNAMADYDKAKFEEENSALLVKQARLREYGLDLDAALKHFSDAPIAEGFAKIVALSRIGSDAKSYGDDIKNAANVIKDICKRDGVTNANKDFRDAVAKLALLLNTEESDLYIPFVFKANARLADRVFQSVRKVSSYDKDGVSREGKLSTRNIVTECVLSCVRELQLKAQEKKEQETKKAKKEG